MSLRVLHVIPSVSPKHGGPSVALPLFTAAAAAQGVTVTVATTNDDGPGAALDVPLGQLVPGAGNANYIYFQKNTEFYKVSWKLRNWLRHNVGGYDVVHIHALFSFSSYAAAKAATRTGVPYIVRPLGVLHQWGLENRRPFVKRWSLRLVELPILRSAAAIHYTAEAEHREAISLHPDLGSVRSAIIPIPVKAAPISGAPQLHERFPVTAGRRVILFLSRLDVKKGIELLLEAFQEIRAEFADALLVIAGAGDAGYVEGLRQKARGLGCEADVFWSGFVAGAEKDALLTGAKVFVLPSHSENFGIAAAEALAAGLPTILSDQIAIARDAADAGAALMVPREKERIAAAIGRLLKEDELRERLRRNAWHFVARHFSAEAVGAALMQLYESVSRKGTWHA